MDKKNYNRSIKRAEADLNKLNDYIGNIDKLNEIDTFLSNQTEEYNEAVIEKIKDILNSYYYYINYMSFLYYCSWWTCCY